MTDSNNRMKSALEIALERAGRMGSLSDKEKRKLKFKELEDIGNALAGRYLNGLPLRDIELELGRYKGDDSKIIRHYLVSRLIDSVDIENISIVPTILVALQRLCEDKVLLQKFVEIVQEYQAAIEKERKGQTQALYMAEKEQLELKGIRGSAVEPALDSCPEYLQILQPIESHFHNRIENLKREYKTENVV